VAVGAGRTRAAHGNLPVPVPAVLELARGWQVLAGGEGELATPTGMALLRALAEECGPIPAMAVTAVGIGAGRRDTAERANVVRVVVGTAVADAPAAAENPTISDAPATSDGSAVSDAPATSDAPTTSDGPAVSNAPTTSDAPAISDMWVLETNVDDLDPRLWPTVLAALLAAGAADAWLVPILMKKGRPAHTLCVLAHDADRAALRDTVFTLTPTLGVRETPVSRVGLQRDWRAVTLPGGDVRIKVGLRAGRIAVATAEFEDAAELARARGVPVRQVLDEATAAAEAAGLGPGAPWSPPSPQHGAAI
jgi:pyridinium-3,5-bisthiocarboxylic acid mononucleotide nickel chelatase